MGEKRLYAFTPLADPAPIVTERMSQLLVDVANGRMQAMHYADSLWGVLKPIQGEIKTELAALGGVRSATLIERTDAGNGLTAFSYVIVFDNARVLMRFVFDDKLRVHSFESLRGEAVQYTRYTCS